jgi:hypothetical protein
MKLYIQDCGWRGSIIVIAENEMEARSYMCDQYNYDKDLPLEEEEIRVGFIYTDLGDC